MSNFSVRHALAPGAEKVYSTTKATTLGAYGETPDGRTFRYALNGGTALPAGAVIQQLSQASGTSVGIYADALTANLANGVGATIATGVTTITLTTGSTAIGVNFYQDGYLYVKVGPGGGAYLIKEHTAASSVSNMSITLYAGDKIDRVAHTTATRYGLQANLYSNVVITPVAATGVPIGVAHTSVPASNYFWAQVGGPAPAQTSGGVVIPSDRFVLSTSQTGALLAATTLDPDQLRATVGWGIHIGVTSALIDMVQLTLD